ncbi:hypothetical protein [Nocardiopsis halophila]|uniref:hypothetical protein n=1 Tax=Nocardiopsis halophila TaxID=141692 RepID=UPI000347170A|nr:hypothetical protein [Nocardiopsis halophila]
MSSTDPAGEVPDRRCRDVPERQLAPGECDFQTAFGMPGSTYCGAAKEPGSRWCDYHEWYVADR